MWRAGCFNGRPGELWSYCSALRRRNELSKKSDLYDGGSRQVTSANRELCAPASPRRSRDLDVMGDGGERGSWCNDGGAADWHEVTPGRRHKKTPPETR